MKYKLFAEFIDRDDLTEEEFIALLENPATLICNDDGTPLFSSGTTKTPTTDSNSYCTPLIFSDLTDICDI